MSLHGKLTAVLCVLALALGLAACGGGSGIATLSIDTAKDQRNAISSAIQTARNAVGALKDSSTDAEIDRAQEAVDKAKKEVADADALSSSEKSGFNTAISVIEDRLAEKRTSIAAARGRQQGQQAREAERLTATFAASRISDIGAALRHGAAPVMSGTVPGATPVSVAGLETAAAGGARTVGTWRGGTYTAGGEDTADTVVLYTNIEAPGTQPFSGEGGKYSAANGLDTDGNLPIADTTDATLIDSDEFLDAAGIMTHEAGSDGTARIGGTFNDAEGEYVCTPAAGLACTSSVKAGGGYDLGGGSWKFVPAEGAEVANPDAEYQYFGWWLRRTGDALAVGTFHAGAGGATDEFRDLATLQSTARYTGPAIGKFAIRPRLGGAAAGDFAATVTLKVDFGDASELGTVGGTVGGFTVAGESRPWSVELGTARIGSDGRISAGETDTALTVWSIGDNAGDTPATQPPTWGGRFHDVGESRVPATATGVFEASYDGIGRMIGAFGATRQ